VETRDRVTQASQHPTQTGFAAALRAAVESMRETSDADIVALYPYDEVTDGFYAPIAIGLPESDLVHSLPDFADQLQRFRSDQAEGKTPDDLSPRSYGTSAWLLTMRRPFITADAMQDAESSFVRRHKIEAIVALPLMVGSRIVGLLYLNYVERRGKRSKVDVSAPTYLERIGEASDDVAIAIDAARRAEESEILRSISTLVSDFSALPAGPDNEVSSSMQLEAALHRVLAAAHLDAAALYVPLQGRNRLSLLATHGFQSATAETIPLVGPDEILRDETLNASLAAAKLHPLVALAPRGQGHQGILVLADHDPLVLERRLPMDHTLLQTAADLLGAMLHTGRMAQALEDTNRTLGAVTRLSMRLLQPGATQDETLRTAVAALTDPGLPELDFEIADIFLLESDPDGGLSVSACAGATASPDIPSIPDERQKGAGTRRIPTWAAPGVRKLDPQDVLAYAASRRRAIVVAARDAQEHDDFVSGYPEDGLERLSVPVVRNDGSSAASVHAARLREAADRAPMRGDADEGSLYRPTNELTLNAEMFDEYGHGSLVRVFVPFGSNSSGDRATGVLEAGFHTSRAQSIGRVQIEALRACAATVAVAVETARLYEDVTLRARQLEIVTEVSRAIATSIDLDQTLRLVARNMARAVDASVCLIALLDEDGSAWYGAAASDQDELWRHRRVERPEQSIVFEVADHERPVVVEDAMNNELVSPYMARLLGLRSLIALPLQAGEGDAFGAVLLGQRDRQRIFSSGEIERLSGLASQAAMAIRNARVHAREEEEHHIQKDVVLVGFGQWGQKAYKHLVLLKSFFNFRTHVVEADLPGRRQVLSAAEETVLANGDLFYWDSPTSPAHDALTLELEPSCYVITYIATPAETHLPLLKSYYDLSNVILIEKPLGAPPEEYRAFLDSTDGSVQIVAADHYWFKTEVRLLENLLTEERNLRAFLDEIEEVEIEILEEQEPGGSGAQIGMIADLIPHAFAVLSLLTPLDHLKLDPYRPVQVGRYQPLRSEHETYARLLGSFDHRGRHVRVTIDVGKGVANAKWIKLSGERRMGGRRSFYKFDFTKGEAIDGTQSALRAATRPIRQPGVPDNAHLSMLRHIVEKRHPAVGILSIREALRANARIQQIEQTAADLIASGNWMPYEHGQRPAFPNRDPLQMLESRDASAHATGE
jgi:GAF domain-containing protein